MSSPIQPKADQLAAALAPHLGAAPTRTLKGVAKSLRRLARQLINQQAKQEKSAAKAALPTAKKQRNTLAGELLTALHPHLGLDKAAGNEVPKKNSPDGEAARHAAPEAAHQAGAPGR